MTVDTISPLLFATYLQLVETPLTIPELAARLGCGRHALIERQTILFRLLGVRTRLELMAQYHRRERDPGHRSPSIAR